MFDDFLEMVIYSISLGAKEDRYHEIVRNYEKPDAHLMAEAFGALVMEMDNKGEGLKDGFGDFYMKYLSYGHNGQFFTLEPICDMMARMLTPAGFREDCQLLLRIRTDAHGSSYSEPKLPVLRSRY
ncbi:MAG: hypothetical protein JNK09_18060 [Prolixibacteraceae bacterium]|nr:hypothetical protein [Prolixibacteraceae bacterium]